MPGPKAAKPLRVWYWRPASQTAVLAVLFMMIPFWTIIFVGVVAGVARLGLILCGVELALGAVVLSALSPLIMLRADEIRIWHGFRFINIGMSEIAGIGMLYAHIVGDGGDWCLNIWRDDGSTEATGFKYLRGSPRLAPGKGGRRNWVRQATYDPVASDQLPALSGSRAATVGRDLCQRVLAAQGPDGQLATRHLEKRQSPVRLAALTQVIAYWSPDGQCGHCH
jgi:hypothetical protein